MGLETGTYISDLVITNPTSSDPKSQGDDHLRLIKSTVKATFPNVTGAVTGTQTELNILDGATLSTAELNILDGVTASTAEINILDGATLTTTELNYVDGVTSAIQTQIDLKAPLASPALTGTPTAPTASTGTSSTQIATTEFVANTSFTTNLPAQTGNNGKLLKTDGTNASWSATIDTSIVTPTAGTAFVTTTATQTLDEKTLSNPIFSSFADPTKKAQVLLSEITAGQTRNITIANEAMTLFTPGLRLLSTVTASNSATVDVETTFDSTYDSYIIEATGVTVQTNGVEFQYLMKIGGSYITTATYNGTGRNIAAVSAGSYAMLTDNVSNAASASISFSMRIPTPSSTTLAKCSYFSGIVGVSATADLEVGGAMMNTGTGALTGIRFQASSGNIVSGSFRLYGIRKT